MKMFFAAGFLILSLFTMNSTVKAASQSYYDDLEDIEDVAFYVLTPLDTVLTTPDSQTQVLQNYSAIANLLQHRFIDHVDCFGFTQINKFENVDKVRLVTTSSCFAVKKDTIKMMDKFIAAHLAEGSFYNQQLTWTKPKIVSYQIYILSTSPAYYGEEYIYKVMTNEEVVTFSKKLRAIMYSENPSRIDFESLVKELGFSDQQIAKISSAITNVHDNPTFMFSLMPIVDDGFHVPFSTRIAATPVYRECSSNGCFLY